MTEIVLGGQLVMTHELLEDYLLQHKRSNGTACRGTFSCITGLKYYPTSFPECACARHSLRIGDSCHSDTAEYIRLILDPLVHDFTCKDMALHLPVAIRDVIGSIRSKVVISNPSYSANRDS